MKRNLVALALAASLWACGGTPDGGAGEVGDRSVYPTENIGLEEGQVLADLSFQRADGSTFSMDGDIFKNEKNRVLLLTTTAGWCSACIEEQPQLAAMYEEYKDRGLTIVAALFQDSDFNPATLQQVQAWEEEYKLPYPVVLDDAFKLEAYYDAALTPMNMVVDVDTMEILKIGTGVNIPMVRAVIEANID